MADGEELQCIVAALLRLVMEKGVDGVGVAGEGGFVAIGIMQTNEGIDRRAEAIAVKLGGDGLTSLESHAEEISVAAGQTAIDDDG